MHVEGHGALTMELSESVQRGFQTLADPGSFDSNAFALLLRAAFQSLLDAQADEAVLGKQLGAEPKRPGWRALEKRSGTSARRSPGRGSLPAAVPFAPDGVCGRDAAGPADPEHCSVPLGTCTRLASRSRPVLAQSLCSFCQARVQVSFVA